MFLLARISLAICTTMRPQIKDNTGVGSLNFGEISIMTKILKFEINFWPNITARVNVDLMWLYWVLNIGNSVFKAVRIATYCETYSFFVWGDGHICTTLPIMHCAQQADRKTVTRRNSALWGKLSWRRKPRNDVSYIIWFLYCSSAERCHLLCSICTSIHCRLRTKANH